MVWVEALLCRLASPRTRTRAGSTKLGRKGTVPESGSTFYEPFMLRLNKEDIGMPTNFQHISHVGWDPNHGFDLENVDPNLKKFFQKAGVDEKALQDKDTRDFIYDFIDKHGGVEAALREV